MDGAGAGPQLWAPYSFGTYNEKADLQRPFTRQYHGGSYPRIPISSLNSSDKANLGNICDF